MNWVIAEISQLMTGIQCCQPLELEEWEENYHMIRVTTKPNGQAHIRDSIHAGKKKEKKLAERRSKYSVVINGVN